MTREEQQEIVNALCAAASALEDIPESLVADRPDLPTSDKLLELAQLVSNYEEER